jgi:hypothetical protein
MPTGTAVRQAIIDNEANGKFNDGVCVIGLRRSDRRHVDIEMFFALATVVGGVPHDDFDRSAGVEVAEMTEFSLSDDVSSGGTLAKGTGGLFRDTRTLLNLWFRQLIGTSKFFGRVRQIVTGTGHSRILLDFRRKEDSLPNSGRCVKGN